MAESETLVSIIDKSMRNFSRYPVFGTKMGGAYHWMTYGELGNQISKARAALSRIGFKAGDRVGIISSNRVEWAVVAFAAYQLGGVVVPMYETQSPDDLSYIIRDAEPSVLAISNAKVFRRLLPIFSNLPSVGYVLQFEGAESGTASYEEWMRETGQSAPVKVTPDQLAALIYTSGTTGRPKGVMLSHRNFASNILAVRDLIPIGPGDVSLSFLPWAHAFGQTVELYTLMSVGAAMGLAERVDTILDNLTEVRPTMLVSVPRIFNRIYEKLNQKIEEEGGLKKKLFYAGLANTEKLRDKEAADKDGVFSHLTNLAYDRLVFSKVKERFGGRMKYAFSGGAALAPEVAHFIDNLNIVVYEGYGLSETAPIISANYPGHKKIGSVGRPIPGVSVVIDTKKGNFPGEGEIINYGPNNMLGYYHLPKETNATLMPDGGLRTGDLGYLDDEGYLYVTGRVKDLYKLENGKYVAPAPLEDQLTLSPYIMQAMLFGDNLPYNIALVVPDSAGLEHFCMERKLPHGDLEELIERPVIQSLLEAEVARISASWKGFERPRKVVAVPDEWTVENDLLTPTLKVKRRKVVEQYKDLLQSTSSAPRHEHERASERARPESRPER